MPAASWLCIPFSKVGGAPQGSAMLGRAGDLLLEELLA